ncbi:MAG: hypothetical protein Q7S06_01700 [Nanoarchaeota archaeon]|nr:hypothetical protein [Nanoarchaeota archaeon]
MAKKFSLEVFVYVIAIVLLLTGTVYIISANLTGNVVAPNGPRCSDSDGGKVADLVGRCLQYAGGRGKITFIGEDKCLNTKILVEYYCNQHLVTTTPTCVGQIVTCPNGCGVTPEGSRCS